MTVKELYAFIGEAAPFDTQAQWDNSGLLCGDPAEDVAGVVVCLDVTPHEIKTALENGANVIVSHHPVIFRPVSGVIAGTIPYEAVRNGLSVISAHTNLDKAPSGVNDALCEKLGMDYEKCPETVADGFLNVGTLPGVDTPAAAAEYISRKLGAAVRYCAAGEKITKIGVCSGAGADMVNDAAALGCDAFITGDASYHAFLDAAAAGVSLFAAGHFETENPICGVLADRLRRAFPALKVTVSDRRNPVVTVTSQRSAMKKYD